MWQNNNSSFNIRIQTGLDQGDTHTIRLRAGSSGASVLPGTGVEVNVRDQNANSNGELGQGLANFRFESIHLTGATVDSRWGERTNNAPSKNRAFTLDDMDVSLGNVTRMRTFVGSEQNALEASLDSLDLAVENQRAAKQRIEDTDIAKVTSSFTKHQIQQQSSVMVLSQARNVQKDIFLGLLPNFAKMSLDDHKRY